MKRGKTTPKLSSNVKASTWVKVYETTLTEAATSVTISGLAGNTDEIYILRCKFVNGYDGASQYCLRPNNDTGSNYGLQYLSGANTTLSAGRVTPAYFDLAYCGAINRIGYVDYTLYAKSGYLRTLSGYRIEDVTGTTVGNAYILGQSWNNSANEITSLVILSDQANGLGVGSSIILYKKVAS